jgi:hypothetical protein
LKSSRFENALKFYSNLSQFDFSSDSVQKYFKPLILNLKSCLEFKKIERVYAAASLAFGPFRRSAHFHLSFTPIETSPLHLAFWPGTSAPTSDLHRHRRSSGRAAVPPSLPPLNQRRPVSFSPFNSFETDKE